MNKFSLTLFFFVFAGVFTSLFSQDVVWKMGVHSFFDNAEFSGSSVQNSQTMGGAHFAPELGLSWQNKHRLFGGIDVLHEFGSNKAIDYYDPILYYEYTGKRLHFYMGTIPRQFVLDKYPRMFFQDSVMNYRPVINGFFWEFKSAANYANIWLDWISRQTKERHESFFMGWSGRYNRNIFYLQHFGYMFHFAKVKDPVVEESVHDNGLVLTSLGLDLASTTGFENLEANVGYSLGLDRERSRNFWNVPKGILAEVKVEYRGIGLFNTYYKGNRQQVYYSDHSNELYWGDPIYRSNEYDRIDFFINFIKSDVVKIKFAYSLHLTEKQMYHEQSIYATFDLDNLKNKKKEKKYSYLWDNWF
jgi:hypothetical protein